MGVFVMLAFYAMIAVGSLTIYAVGRRVREMREFNRSVEADRKLALKAPGGLFEQPTAIFTETGVRASSSGGGWTLYAECRMRAPSSFTVRRRGMFAPGDIEIGVEGFDRAYHVSGDDKALVRGLLLSDEVRDAIRDTFSVDGEGVKLGADGVVEVVFKRKGHDVVRLRQMAERVARLKDVLSAQPPRLIEKGGDNSAGAGSGAPVSVPLNVHRR